MIKTNDNVTSRNPNVVIRSRGINENDSKIAIIEGFFDPILNSVDEELRDEIKKNISLRLGALNETIN